MVFRTHSGFYDSQQLSPDHDCPNHAITLIDLSQDYWAGSPNNFRFADHPRPEPHHLRFHKPSSFGAGPKTSERYLGEIRSEVNDRVNIEPKL
jgi:hypothetical protein